VTFSGLKVVVLSRLLEAEASAPKSDRHAC